MEPTSPEATPIPYRSPDEIESRAADVRRQHGLTSVPVDPVVLANKLGITVRNAKFSDEGIVGMIAKRGDDITLLVNADDRPFRKRFTIAHELGHHFLHLLEDGEFVDHEADLFRQEAPDADPGISDRRMEIQANMFAASLLMPEEAVRREWPRLRSLAAMARRFNVSEPAMGIRVGQLGLE